MSKLRVFLLGLALVIFVMLVGFGNTTQAADPDLYDPSILLPFNQGLVVKSSSRSIVFFRSETAADIASGLTERGRFDSVR